MTIDEITKLIFILTICLSILSLTFVLVRTAWVVSQNLEDARVIVKNMGTITTNLAKEQIIIEDTLVATKNIAHNIEDTVDGVNVLRKLFKTLKLMLSPKEDSAAED